MAVAVAGGCPTSARGRTRSAAMPRITSRWFDDRACRLPHVWRSLVCVLHRCRRRPHRPARTIHVRDVCRLRPRLSAAAADARGTSGRTTTTTTSRTSAGRRWGLLAPLFACGDGIARPREAAHRPSVHVALDGSVVGARRRLRVRARSSSACAGRDGAAVAGVDFVDLSARPEFDGVEFHHGVFYDQAVGRDRFDLITMWHFLEHDYDPRRSLAHARAALKPGGALIVEVPRLDSLSFRLFGDRWPGLQAPQHTALYDRERLSSRSVERAGFEVVEHLPYGAFPPYFYLFCGVAFRAAARARPESAKRAIYAYFAGQLLLLPLLPLLNRLNFAMQTVVCRRRRMTSTTPSTSMARCVADVSVSVLGRSRLTALAILPVARRHGVSRPAPVRRHHDASGARSARLWGVQLRVHPPTLRFQRRRWSTSRITRPRSTCSCSSRWVCPTRASS